MDIETEIADYKAKSDRFRLAQETMLAAMPTIIPAMLDATFCYFYAEGNIICGFKTRKEFAKLRALTPKWEKRPPDIIQNKIDYMGTVLGVSVTVHLSEFPPTCKIVEEEVEIPERAAHKIILRRVVCNGAGSPKLEESLA